ncbi:MAG: ASCH domain-containing protein [Pseudomonadota bacterium]
MTDEPYPDAPRFKFADGDRRELCEYLTALTLEGKKTGTCWPLRDMAKGEPMMAVGDIAVYTDWDGVPVCAIEYTAIEIARFDEVSEEFALSEGENETRDGWAEDHRMFFERNGGWSPDMELVCENFRVIERF